MIEGKAKMEFGTGDILITPMVKEDLSKGCVVLQNKGTHKIGEYTDSKDFVGEDEDTIIAFTKIDSIDVLIERLTVLKKMMLGDVEQCSLSVEYDY